MKKLNLILGLVLSAFIGNTFAANEDIFKAMEKLGFNKSEVQINDIAMPNYKSVLTPDGVFYVSDDGLFLTKGPIYSLKSDKIENIANSLNLKLISTISKDGIVFKSSNEKYMINVFTDYTCGYCKKLHNEINDYLKLGISVRYFAFPRKGLDTQTAKDMQSVWSAKNRVEALDKLYKTGSVDAASSMVQSVQMHYNVGRKLGINGTPAIVLPSGELVGGYIPANELISRLER